MLMKSTVLRLGLKLDNGSKLLSRSGQIWKRKRWKSGERDIELTFTFYQFEAELHPRIRTSNLLERLFEEFRRKADEIGAFPNPRSCLTWFFLVVQREHALTRPTLSLTLFPQSR